MLDIIIFISLKEKLLWYLIGKKFFKNSPKINHKVLYPKIDNIKLKHQRTIESVTEKTFNCHMPKIKNRKKKNSKDVGKACKGDKIKMTAI